MISGISYLLRPCGGKNFFRLHDRSDHRCSETRLVRQDRRMNVAVPDRGLCRACGRGRHSVVGPALVPEEGWLADSAAARVVVVVEGQAS